MIMTLDRTTPPTIFSPQEFQYQLKKIDTEFFNNQIPFYSLLDTIEPIFQLELVFEAGLWYENKRAVAQAVTALFKSGTSNMSAFEINETIEQYGASVSAHCGPDWATITISCLTKYLAKIIPLVYELLTDSIFPQEEVDIYIQNAKQRLSMQLLKSDFVANRKIDEYQFGFDHPYGKYVLMEDLDKLQSEDLKIFLQKHYNFTTCKIFLTGSFSENDKKLIASTFGLHTWNQAEQNPILYYKTTPDLEKKHRIQHDEKSVQGSIRLSRFCVEKSHPDFVPMILLNTLFGGFFGSRLMSNIREEKGYTYGIHSMILNQRHATALMISTEVGKEVCELVIQEIYKEMDILKNELVSEDELNLVKNYLLGSILSSIDGSFQIMQRWKSLILNGFDEQRFNNNIEIYKHIQASELQTLAQTYFVQDSFYELIVV